MITGDEGDEGHDDHGHGPLDPHFWFDPNRVKIAVNDIAARLSALDPENIGVYIENALEYGRQLDELHAWIQEQVAAVARRSADCWVTSHDTFAYFADVYGFEIIGALIPSLAPDVEPSAEHLAGLVEVIRSTTRRQYSAKRRSAESCRRPWQERPERSFSSSMRTPWAKGAAQPART